MEPLGDDCIVGLTKRVEVDDVTTNLKCAFHWLPPAARCRVQQTTIHPKLAQDPSVSRPEGIIVDICARSTLCTNGVERHCGDQTSRRIDWIAHDELSTWSNLNPHRGAIHVQ